MNTFYNPFKPGKLYSRQEDIHSKYGGNRQSGISYSKDSPYIFIFTGDTGAQYGYRDGYDEENVLHYTGEGQIGNMVFTRGNLEIRDHLQNGKDLLLFEATGKGKPYKFLGQFNYIGYQYKTIPDSEGQERKGIIFQLMNAEDEGYVESQEEEQQLSNKSLEELRKSAYSSTKTVKEAKSVENKKVYYERNQAIKSYVLRRANGICECCGKPAPFNKPDGTPFLESHHIGKLSDKGMDSPDRMAALTPNCHREIHYSENGKEIDERLAEAIVNKEEELSGIS
ncbi:MAG: HNH endonuclease [Methyloligellaceae bacterium]